MNIPFIKTLGLARGQTDLLTLLRKAAWLLIVLVSIVYSVVASRDDLTQMQSELHKWVYVYFNFLSFVLGGLAGAVIFFRKPHSWMAFATSLMLVTFTATDNGINFWYQLFTREAFSLRGLEDFVPFAVALFISVFYMALLTTSLIYVLLTFPHEKLPSPGARLFFRVVVGGQVILILLIGAICLYDIFVNKGATLVLQVYKGIDIFKSLLLIALAAWQIYRLRTLTDPVKRQQVKWIVLSLTGMTFFYAIGMLISYIQKDLIPLWAFIPLLIFTYGFIITLPVAIARYRLWDMGFFFNKTLVYGAVTGILAVLTYQGAQLLEFFAKEYLETESKLVGAFILLPVAALFTPVRDSMQVLVDRYLKPEDVDFSSAIVELAPDAQLMLSSQDIMRILVRQSMEQLDLASAAIHLRQPDGQLVPREADPAVPDPESSQLRLSEQMRKQLEKGEVVLPPEGSPSSLYVPLVIKRGSRPQFLGVLVFGARHSGEGYPTPVLKSLSKLGCDAGKAIHIAELREHLGRNVIGRLAAIEKSLTMLSERR
ncbi:MAG TPA: hypothetical protein VK888_04545 [Anaerolineales bacterium]|nr:hypothetical protein [Anaerolineales bacterium]